MADCYITDQDIEMLIKCQKVIRIKPRRLPEEIDGSFRNKFDLSSDESGFDFSVFTRQLIKFSEDFSIGLMLKHPEFGDVTLLRCNGFHGPTAKGKYEIEHHRQAHLHKMSASQIEKGFCLNPKIIDVTTEYHDFDSAMLFFCEYCGIIGYEEYYYKQQKLDI